MASERPTVVVQKFCDQHRRDLIHRRLKLGPDEAWLANEVMAQILMFAWITTNPRFCARTRGGSVAEFSLVLGEIGCMACFDHDGYLHTITILRKGLGHASEVARGEVTDSDWPIRERIAALAAPIAAEPQTAANENGPTSGDVSPEGSTPTRTAGAKRNETQWDSICVHRTGPQPLL